MPSTPTSNRGPAKLRAILSGLGLLVCIGWAGLITGASVANAPLKPLLFVFLAALALPAFVSVAGFVRAAKSSAVRWRSVAACAVAGAFTLVGGFGAPVVAAVLLTVTSALLWLDVRASLPKPAGPGQA